MFTEGDNIEKQINQGTFNGTRGEGRPKLRWSDGLKAIIGHSLNTQPCWREQMPIEWFHIMGHNGSAVTRKKKN